MRTGIVVLAFAAAVTGLQLRHGGILDQMDTDEVPEEKPFEYKPSNANTRAPRTFNDEMVIDESYHELVPGLQVLNDLTTTVKPSNQY